MQIVTLVYWALAVEGAKLLLGVLVLAVIWGAFFWLGTPKKRYLASSR